MTPKQKSEHLTPRPRTKFLLGAAFVITTGLGLLLLGGLCESAFVDVLGSTASDESEWLTSLCLTGLVGAVSVASGVWLARRIPRRVLYLIVFSSMVATVTIVLAEVVSRLGLPAWPASALHGVRPSVQQALMTEAERNDVGAQRNAWGQRDRERSLRPAAGVLRVAFIGDSFLEEGIGAPLSLVTERLLDRADVEVVNLGVSATSPDEYFYRAAHVALPLEATGCVVCIYLGNDLAADHRTLPSWFGIAAVSPRPALLTTLGLRGLNDVLTTRERPVLKIWSNAGGLGESEKKMHESCRNSSDRELAELLLRNAELPPQLAELVRPQMLGAEMASFYNVLRDPDEGRFRSYFLFDGVWLKATGMTPQILSDPASTLHWVRVAAAVYSRPKDRSGKLARRASEGVGINGGVDPSLARRASVETTARFLVVLIPEGFAVDPRMQEQWAPLADMRRMTDKTSAAGRRIEQELTQAGIEVLNLTDTLAGVRGTYLNVDGHWSPLGIETSAAAVAAHLRRWLEEP